jgi:hypothetical protein
MLVDGGGVESRHASATAESNLGAIPVGVLDAVPVTSPIEPALPEAMALIS